MARHQHKPDHSNEQTLQECQVPDTVDHVDHHQHSTPVQTWTPIEVPNTQALQVEYYPAPGPVHIHNPASHPFQPSEISHQPGNTAPVDFVRNARLLLEMDPSLPPLPFAPELLRHQTTGDSVIEGDSVLDPESGRFYHGKNAGKYFLPNDEAEQNRLDLQHHAFSMLLHQRLSFVPFRQEPRHVLDIATGTGIWAIKFAKQHPNATVIGTDLSAIQPKSPVPNCSFVKEDSEEQWMFDHSFDYIHLRFVYTCFDNHKTVLRNAFDNLNPGGWIEYQDSAMALYSASQDLRGTKIQRYTDMCHSGAARLGRDMMAASHYKDWLIEQGFVDVYEEKIAWPVGLWPRDSRMQDIGKWMLKNLFDNIRGISFKIVAASGMSPEQIHQLSEEVKKQMLDESLQLFAPCYIVYGRKPYEWETAIQDPETAEW